MEKSTPVTLANHIGKSIYLKIRGNEPATAALQNVEDGGVWLGGDTLTKQLLKGGVLPPHLKMPEVFVPFENLEWVMVAKF